LKIYTGFGDEGNTALFGGKIVKKNHVRVEVYGTLDELNSLIGLLRSKNKNNEVDKVLFRIQNELFVISAEIATPDDDKRSKFSDQIGEPHISGIESEIDHFNNYLEPLKNFILPGGSDEASIAHVARTVCRRAERLLVSLNDDMTIRKFILIYLNRLSDLFFVLARYLNKLNNVKDVNWKGLQ
jgi:cob(I)alamin adenosyltransferase